MTTLTGCTGSRATDAVTVTVTSAAAAPAVAALPSAVPAPSPAVPAPSPVVPGHSSLPAVAPPDRSAGSGGPTSGSDRSGASRSTRSGAAPGVRQPSADPAVPGPDNGPPCRVAPRYSDEPTTGLRADVIAGWRTAVARAARAGVVLCLNDGKRSAAQQRAIFTQYVQKYGSRQLAREYVLPPEKSAHVKGYAVDVQPANAYQWLQATRGSLGWCRIYDNEPWHFEFSAGYVGAGCPARLPRPVG